MATQVTVYLKPFRWVLASMSMIFVTPISAYYGIHSIYKSSPDIVYYQRLNETNAKWEKIGESNDFAEYVDPGQIIEKHESIFYIVAMRNYFDSQKGAEELSYFSKIIEEEIDCVNRSIKPKQVTFFKEKLAKGNFSEGPFAMRGDAFYASPNSIANRKIEYICNADKNEDRHFI